MNKQRSYAGVFSLVLLLLLVLSATQAAPQAANFVGTWQLTMEGGGNRGGGGGNGGGGNGGGRGRRGGGGAQTLTITQDSEKFKVTHKTPRSEDAFDAGVSGNAISWTETRQGRNGNSISMEYKATVDGDTMQGTVAGGQFSRQFTAKRSN
jgi:hypothetical protein